MKKNVITILIAVGVIVLGAVFLFSGQNAGRSEKSIGQRANLGPLPQLSFTDYDGRPAALADFFGTPMVVNSWAAWCPFCKEELVDFAQVQKELGDKVVIIAVNRAESLATARKFSDERGITGDLVFLLDPQDRFYQTIRGFSMPETIFVDSEGNIVEHKRGPMKAAEIKSKIMSLE